MKNSTDNYFPLFLRSKAVVQCFFAFMVVAACLVSIPARAATVEDFSRHSQYHNIKISPDGKHFAALVNANGGKSLVFLDAKTFKVIYAHNSNWKSQPGDYYWVNNERVVMQVIQQRGFFGNSVKLW